ncbi:hypothetical protein FQA39_LY11282 [Lamprigera yunnana]|nr:hypothetical protein FQA39_LY11282 [Lamprigera yunnana]
MRKLKSLLDACILTYWFSVLSGAIAIRRTENRYFRSHWQIPQILLYLAIFCHCALNSINEDIIPFPQVRNSEILNFVSVILVNTLNVATIVWYITCLNNAKQMCNCLREIIEIDNNITERFPKQTEKKNYIIWMKSFIILGLWCCYICCLVLQFLLNPAYSFAQFVTIVMFEFMNISTFLQYSVWTTVIRDRLFIINDYLETNYFQTYCSDYPIDEEGFEEDLNTIHNLHKRLVQTARSINVRFYCFLLLYVFFYYTALASVAYVIVYIFAFTSVTDWYNFATLCGFLQFIMYTSFIISILTCSEKLCYEANRTGEVLSSIKINILKVTSRKLVISKCLSLMNNKLEITACQLFKINMPLLHSIIASVTVYLVIMVQFDLEMSKVLMKKKENSTNVYSIQNFTL